MPSIDPAHNTCIVVKGFTAILLDNDSDFSFLTELAFDAIEKGLNNQPFLEGFTDNVIAAALTSSGYASLVETSDHYHSLSPEIDDLNLSPITATVAVAAASVSIVVASIFCYGFVRRPPSEDPSVRHRNRSYRNSGPRTLISSSIGSIGNNNNLPHRRFIRLEDISASPASFVTTNISPHSVSNAYYQDDFAQEIYTPTVTWSISDITSDSASLRSGLSHTPSMLERIEEEVEEAFSEIVNEDSSNNIQFPDDSKAAVISSKKNSNHINYIDDDCYGDYQAKSIADFDCKCQEQDQILDVSDLDDCFTIASVPKLEKNDDDDLNYSSSCSTENNTLEISFVDTDTKSDNSMKDHVEEDVFLKTNDPSATARKNKSGLMLKFQKESEEKKREKSSSANNSVSSSTDNPEEEVESFDRMKRSHDNKVGGVEETANKNEFVVSSYHGTELVELDESIDVRSCDNASTFSSSECLSKSSYCTTDDDVGDVCTSNIVNDLYDIDIVAADSIDLWVSELMEE